MTNHTAVIPDVEADIRWRDWQARGAASDRRTATRPLAMRRLRRDSSSFEAGRGRTERHRAHVR